MPLSSWLRFSRTDTRQALDRLRLGFAENTAVADLRQCFYWKRVTELPHQESFFLRSAQRFFIARDNRFLPSGVIPPRFVSFAATGCCWAAGCWAETRGFRASFGGEAALSRAWIARSSRDFSSFNSSTILLVSNISFFPVVVAEDSEMMPKMTIKEQ
jgi:hypothetical protein